MSTEVSRNLTINYGQAKTYFTNGSGLDLDNKTFSCVLYADTFQDNDKSWAKYNAAALSILYPNATAHPTKAFIQVGGYSFGIKNGDYYVTFNGTEVFRVTCTSDYAVYNATKNDAAIKNSTRDTVDLRWWLRHGTLTGLGTGENTLRLYFIRYDLSAVAGNGISSATVSSATGYDGDTITFTATVQNGYAFDGWYAGSTKVSGNQSYTHTVNGSDLALTAKAVSLYTNLYVKDGTTYSRVKDVYKKVNGVYVKQTNIPALFPDGVKLKRKPLFVNLVPVSASRTEGLWSGGSIDTAHIHSALGLTRSLRLDGVAGAPEALSNCTTQMAQVQGHTYYWRIYEYHTDNALNGCSAQIYWPVAEPSMGYASFGAAGQWKIISDVIVRNSWASGNQSWRVDFNNNNLAGSVWYTGIMMIDLTAAYGAGKEPSKAWCDANIPYFTGMTGG